MKILHLSDLHIGIKLYNYDLEEDQKYVLQQVIDLAEREQPDAIVIAGDIYDKSVPSADAVALFDWFATRLQEVADAKIMMISGNHDSMHRIDCYRKILERQGIYMIGMPPVQKKDHIEKITLKDEFGSVHFYLMPFVKPASVRELIGEGISSHDKAVHCLLEREDYQTKDRNVLVSHQFYISKKEDLETVERAENESVTVGNIDSVTADCLDVFDYVALGHLHRPMKVGRESVRYCGTPMAYSLSEEGQEKHALLVTLQEKGTNPQIEEIPLQPLRKVVTEKGTLEEVLERRSNNFVRIVLTEKPKMEQRDLQNKLYEAFPYLLMVQVEDKSSHTQADLKYANMKELSPMEIIKQFYGNFDEEDMSLLQEIMNCVEEVEE